MSNNYVQPAVQIPIEVAVVVFGETVAVGPPPVAWYSDDGVLLGEREFVHSEITTPILE